MQIIRISHDSFSLWRDQIVKLFNSSVRINFPEAKISATYGKEKCREVDGFLEDGSAIVFAAVEGEKLAGWVWCHQIHRVDGIRFHIAEIAVADEWKRLGIGSQLLDVVEQYVVEKGYNEIDLFVTASNQSAVSFYEKADYKPERFLMKKNIQKIARTGENEDV